MTKTNSLYLLITTALILGLFIIQYQYKGYNIIQDTISQLGVGSTALEFNLLMIIIGISLIASNIIKRSPMATIAGIDLIGIGVFPVTTGLPHTLFALIAFIAMVAGTREIAILLAISGISFILFWAEVYLPSLFPIVIYGLLERMIMLPYFVRLCIGESK